MKTKLILITVSLTTFFLSSVFSDNRLMVLPQIAAGDDFSTTIQLENVGTEPFDGKLIFYGDEGALLQLKVNGIETSGFLFFQLPATSRTDFILTKTGPISVGHAVVADVDAPNDFSFSPLLHGTVLFRTLAASGTIQSIGVPIPVDMEHFLIPVEVSKTNQINTGVAISNAFNFDNPLPNSSGSRTIVTMRAVSDTGATVSGASFAMNLNWHRAFFFDEVLNLPPQFRGYVEVQSQKAVAVLALRLERAHLSLLPVDPVKATYEVSIAMDGGDRKVGEMMFSIAGGFVEGFFRFLGPVPFNPASFFARMTQFRLSGSGREGLFRAMVTLPGEDDVALILEQDQTSIRTANSLNQGRVVWTRSEEMPLYGVFEAHKREVPAPDPASRPCADQCPNGLPPEVDAGPETTSVVGGQELVLQGVAADPNLPAGAIPSFTIEWSITDAPEGLNLQLNDSDQLKARLITPEVTEPVTITVELEVTQSSNGCTCSDEISVTLLPN